MGLSLAIESGVIDEASVSDEGTKQSFIITLDKGGSCLRNKGYIKHLRDTITMNTDDDGQANPPYMNIREEEEGTSKLIIFSPHL